MSTFNPIQPITVAEQYDGAVIDGYSVEMPHRAPRTEWRVHISMSLYRAGAIVRRKDVSSALFNADGSPRFNLETMRLSSIDLYGLLALDHGIQRVN